MPKKKLIIINGTMGAGKTSVCQELYTQLADAVFLDGDWCWMMHPFKVTDENKRMVEDNITYLLRKFLTNSGLQHIVFTWVIHQQHIMDSLLEKLSDLDYDLVKISLVCSAEALSRRLAERGTPDQTENSIKRLALYEQMDTIKLDTTNMTVPEVVERALTIIAQG